MKVLVIGKGGREHSLVWRLHQSETVWKIFCATGNPGIDQIAEAVPIAPTDVAALLEFAKSKSVDLTIVGPDDVVATGIVDHFTRAGLKIFGPTAAAAQLETSKSFAKTIMREAGVPTADFAAFDDAESALRYVNVAQRIDGRQGGRAGARQRRHHLPRHQRGSGSHHRGNGTASIRRGGQSRHRRGVSHRPGSFVLCAVRRRERGPVRHVPGSQGDFRRRPRPQHRRDGRVFAGAAIRTRTRSAHDARSCRADAGGDECTRHPVSRTAVRRADDRRRRSSTWSSSTSASAIRNANH